MKKEIQGFYKLTFNEMVTFYYNSSESRNCSNTIDLYSMLDCFVDFKDLAHCIRPVKSSRTWSSHPKTRISTANHVPKYMFQTSWVVSIPCSISYYSYFGFLPFRLKLLYLLGPVRHINIGDINPIYTCPYPIYC